MNNGFVGVNVGQAVRDLENFRSIANQIENKLAQASNEFADGIVNNWASPRAVEFEKEYNYKLIDLYAKPKEIFDSILYDAACAISNLASQQGVSFDPTRYYPQSTSKYYGNGAFRTMRESGPNGEVGMDSNAVQGTTVAFLAQVSSAVSLIGNLPSAIAIYDAYNRVQGTFRTRINQAGSIVNELADNILKSIQSNINQEQSNLNSAVNQSASVLQG